MQENQTCLDVNQKANFAGQVAAQWLNVRLQLLGVAMVTGVAFIAVLEHHFQSVNPGRPLYFTIKHALRQQFTTQIA